VELRRTDQRTINLKASSQRPLLQAVNGLSDEYGWIVNFEEPELRSSLDLVDTTPREWQVRHPKARRILRARGGAFASSYVASRYLGVESDDMYAVLSKLVADYNASGHPGSYAVRRDAEGYFSIVGESAKDQSGTLRRVSPVLDARVAIPRMSTDALTAITVILEGLRISTGKEVRAALVPVNLLVQKQVSLGGSASARSHLREVIAATGVNLSWRLLYNPSSGSYDFNMTVQRRIKVNSDGSRSILRRPDERS
jgi:hypothetical protein